MEREEEDIFRFIELKLDKWLRFMRSLAPSCVIIYELILVIAVKVIEYRLYNFLIRYHHMI